MRTRAQLLSMSKDDLLAYFLRIGMKKDELISLLANLELLPPDREIVTARFAAQMISHVGFLLRKEELLRKKNEKLVDLS